MKTVAILLSVSVAATAVAETWFVDSVHGDDSAVGTSEATAVRSLERANKLAVKPGDTVLFRRGGLWRGTLYPKSGTPGNPVTYSSYGVGEKPILQQSVDRSRPEDWELIGENLWSTKKRTPPVMKEQFWDGSAVRGSWGASYQEGNRGRTRTVEENGERFVRVTLEKKVRAAPNLLQLWGPKVENLPDAAMLRLKVRSTKPFAFGNRMGLSLNVFPWTGALSGQPPLVEIGSEWRVVEIPMRRVSELTSAYFHFSIGDVMPEGAVFDFVPLGLWRMEEKLEATIPADVGIFICNHGQWWGRKKWHKPDWPQPWANSTNLMDDLEFRYIPEEERVEVRYPRNPGQAFSSIELALTRHIVSEGGCHDVVYDGLSVRYGAAHGFGGGGTRNIVIRNCDIYWIGGGLQFWKKDEKTGLPRYPVRFGNGIEFWGECHNNLVERNRLWQIYDAALTNQTKDDPRWETDVVWRDNVIWQAEYSFEYWNHDPRSFTGNILFEHNTCIDAGYCWSHTHRPNPNGAHLMLYDNAAPTTNFVVRNNLFVRTTDRSTRFFNDWRVKNPAAKDGLEMDHNLYWIPENMVCEYHVNGRERRQKLPIRLEPGKWGAGETEFKRYQAEFNIDQGSVYGKPQFVDEAKRDYRLKPGTFGTNLATDGGPLGARDMPGLDGDQSR